MKVLLTACLLFAATLFLAGNVEAQQCPLPDEETVRLVLMSILISETGEGTDIQVTLLDYHFTCLTVAARDLFQQFSVAVKYNTSASSVIRYAQVQMVCGLRNSISASSSLPLEENVSPSVFNLTTRIDCQICTAATSISAIDTDANCFPCSDECRRMGQGACNNNGVCCPFFVMNGACTANCPVDFGASAETNFTCVCNLTCANGGLLVRDNCTCNCPPQFTGKTCETAIDECTPNPCLNGGSCVNLRPGFECRCLPGFTGQLCDIDIDECDPNPCLNGGSCTDGINSFTCQCPPGYTGSICDIDIDECDSNPCLNGGNCTDGINSFTCQCPPGYTGSICDIDIDECDSNPCLNGGNCTDGINSFTCQCPPGYTGSICDIDIDECDSNPCLNGGNCTDGINSFTCQCPPGYTGSICDIDIDECDPNPCLNGGNCTDGINSFTCQCPPGYTGPQCETNIDECDPNPCRNGGNCTDLINGFQCVCAVGYTGMTCEVCATGYMMESGQCVGDCNTVCSGKNTFDFDICRFVCLVRIWKTQAENCGIRNLPNMSDIDTNLPEIEQWNRAVSWWKELRNIWSVEAVSRGFKVTSPTPNLDTRQPRVEQWETSLEQWRMDHQTWQMSSTQLSSGFPQQDLASLNFNFTGTTPAQQSTAYSTVVDLWTTASDDYESDLADQCPRS